MKQLKHDKNDGFCGTKKKCQKHDLLKRGFDKQPEGMFGVDVSWATSMEPCCEGVSSASRCFFLVLHSAGGRHCDLRKDNPIHSCMHTHT